MTTLLEATPSVWPPEVRECSACKRELGIGVIARRCSGCLSLFCSKCELGVCSGCEAWVCFQTCEAHHVCAQHRPECHAERCYCRDHDA